MELITVHERHTVYLIYKYVVFFLYSYLVFEPVIKKKIILRHEKIHL